MYLFKVNGKEYKVRFTYRAICEGDVLDKVMGITDFAEDEQTPKGMVNKLVKTTAELLLVGLQKYHAKEFGYDTEEKKAERIEAMLDLFDDYEDESTAENPQTVATLLSDLQEELQKNGFLSTMMRSAQEMTEMEQTAEQTKAEMESESARVIAMTPTESKS